MKRFLFILFFIQTFSGFSQADFPMIDSTSSVACKNDLYREYQKRFEITNKNISASNHSQKAILKEIYNETQNNFLETISRNNFLCDNNINPYLQGLFNEVLTKNEINGKDFKIILSKNSEVNASNYGEGTVVLNYGMFLAIDNEDELVFVLSHEIGHQYLNHVKNTIENYARLTTSQEIKNKTKEIQSQKYGKASKAYDLLKSIKYQNYSKRRMKEIEADSLGLQFYKKTLRNPTAAITLLQKLDHADTEKDSLILSDYKAIFEGNGFKIKEKYFVEEESLFKKYDSEKRIEIDSVKSHPDCQARIKLIEKYLNNKLGGNATVSPKFSELKKYSTYQNLINLYSDKRYGVSLYETLKLYKNDVSNVFYKKIIYLNFQELYKSKTNYTINRYVPAHDNKHNSSSLNRFISFINNIKMTDFEILINNFNQ